MKSADAYVLAGLLIHRDTAWTYASVARSLHVPLPAVQRACARAHDAGLYEPSRKRIHLANAEEFFLYGLRFVAPAQLGPLAAGVPTAWGASPLRDKIMESGDDPPPVWPFARGTVRGHAVTPLHPKAPDAAQDDPRLHALLSVIDGIRVGDLRVRSVAQSLLRDLIQRRDL